MVAATTTVVSKNTAWVRSAGNRVAKVSMATRTRCVTSTALDPGDWSPTVRLFTRRGHNGRTLSRNNRGCGETDGPVFHHRWRSGGLRP
jgi:hypothetical protein